MSAVNAIWLAAGMYASVLCYKVVWNAFNRPKSCSDCRDVV